MGIAVIGPFAFGVGVMYEHTESWALARVGPLQHLQVTIGISGGEDRAAPDVLVDTDRLTLLVVDEIQL